MGAAAEIGERAVRIQRDRRQRVGGVGVANQVIDQLDLVVLHLGDEARAGLCHWHVLAFEHLRGFDVRAHAIFDGGEVGLGDRGSVRELEVVVETVGDRRADRDLDALVELHHGRRQHVGGVVADQLESLLAALGRQNRQLRPVGQRSREILHPRVLLPGA